MSSGSAVGVEVDNTIPEDLMKEIKIELLGMSRDTSWLNNLFGTLFQN